jgi:circadian clock protein KaiB
MVENVNGLGRADEQGAMYVLRLFIVAGARNSISAQANLLAICQRYLRDRYQLEIVDILQEPQRSIREGIMVTPTLIKLAPGPLVQIAGNLSETALVLQALDIQVEGASDG